MEKMRPLPFLVQKRIYESPPSWGTWYGMFILLMQRRWVIDNMCNLYSKSGMFPKSRDDRPMICFVLGLFFFPFRVGKDLGLIRRYLRTRRGRLSLVMHSLPFYCIALVYCLWSLCIVLWTSMLFLCKWKQYMYMGQSFLWNTMHI